ncbi:uncharacterized protein LOC116618977 [Nematostella vectensis]|uniref:uncharacterized protein LOC116618977 n=1 Tax=Nematostella vectensis TaxID=45351 RepID=UPI002076F337|nr:uncharacterized protein LOC116618977 [Nematostella vectensis]
MASRRLTNVLFLHNSRCLSIFTSRISLPRVPRDISRSIFCRAMKDSPSFSKENLSGAPIASVSTYKPHNENGGLGEISPTEIEEVETKWKRKFLGTKYYGEAVFVLGPMGAGKTTIIENEIKSHEVYANYAYVDTDEIMGILKGFSSDRVEEYYPVARAIAIRLTDWILDRKISFVAEGTCVKYEELIDYMNRLKTGGYVIRVKRLPHIPLELVLERAKHRRNRLVPEHVVRSIYTGSNEGVKMLYEHNREGVLFDDLDMLQERPSRSPTMSNTVINT